MLEKMRCLLRGGHEWVVLRANLDCNLALQDEHPMAACDARCFHCGEKWLDFERHLVEMHGVSPSEIPECERAIAACSKQQQEAWGAVFHGGSLEPGGVEREPGGPRPRARRLEGASS